MSHLPTLTAAVARADETEIASTLAGIAEEADRLAAQAPTVATREALHGIAEELDAYRA